MKYLFALIIIFGVVLIAKTNAQSSNLKVGDKIPSFTLKDQNNNIFSIDSILGKQAIVIYFYPKDDTPGCTKEACSFRDEFETFKNLDAKVIGISSDDVKSHKEFAKKYNLPFTLLADTDKDVRKMFGVPKYLGMIAGRVTYVVDKKGTIVYIFNSMKKAEKHIEEALKALKAL